MAEPDEETRRSIAEQKKEFVRQYDQIVREENEGAFRLLLKAWQIEEGSPAWKAAWDAWREEMAAKRLAEAARKKQPKRPRQP